MSDTERTPSVERSFTSRSNFTEAARQAELDAGIDPTAVYGDEQPRDEQGRFTAAEPVEVTEQATEPEPVAVETADERDARIAALEAQLAEKESFIGRQSNEIGELRQTLEERLAQFDERLNQPQQPRRQITSDFIAENPAAAAQAAYEQQDAYALQAAYEQWKLEDPTGAAVWVAERKADEKLAAERATYEERFKQLEARVTPLAAQSEQQQLAAGVASLPGEVREFLTNQDTVQNLALEFPLVAQHLVNGSAAEKIEAAKTLYSVHVGRTAGTLTRTEQEVARQTAVEAQQARDEAFVASTTGSQETPKTYEQQQQEAAIAAFSRARSRWQDALVKPGK